MALVCTVLLLLCLDLAAMIKEKNKHIEKIESTLEKQKDGMKIKCCSLFSELLFVTAYSRCINFHEP